MDQGAPFAKFALPRAQNGAARARPPALPLDPPAEDDAGDYDALRDLFLDSSPLGPGHGDGQEPMPKPVPPSVALDSRCPEPAAHGAEAQPTAEIEGLILGHLPVFGPAWAGQYARSLADEIGGAVGLIGIRAGQTTLDVYGQAAAGLEVSGTLESALAAAAGIVGRWLIRLDEVNEPGLAESPRLARITLLTGVDETAVVACYRTLKRLVRPEGDGAPSGPAVRLGIMGAALQRAAPAAEKLSRAAETFLGRRVDAAPCASIISPGRFVAVYRGPSEIGLDGVLDLIAAAPRRAPIRPASIAPILRAVDNVSRGVPAAGAPHTGGPGPIVRRDAAQRATPASPTQPLGTPAGQLSLASRIGGLRPLVARCPHAPGVELAADSSGVLHLLAQADEAGGAAAVEDRALTELTACGAWAADHLTLLALTAPEAGLLTSGARPMLHLATRHAPSVRRLLDTDVRIHLIAPVEVEGKSGWACVALN